MDDKTYNVVVLTDDIENQTLTNKISEYIKAYHEVESSGLTILFVAVYKDMLNSNRKRIKLFTEFKASNVDLIIEVEGYGFSTNNSLRDKSYKYIADNNLKITKIK